MVRDQIRRRGVAADDVLRAMEEVPRELFVPEISRRLAYTDHAISIGYAQTISQPFMVAVMTQALAVRPGTRVLEIGTGSGYQAAVLYALGAEVYSIERVPELADRARTLLDEVGCGSVRVRLGDGADGWADASPFEAIVVTAAAPDVPAALRMQMDDRGGRLVAPVGARDLQQLVRVERNGDDWSSERLMTCRFVPLLGPHGWDG